MARTAKIMKEHQRIATYKKYAERRNQLKDLIRDLQKDPKANYDALQVSYAKLNAMPRDASPCRIRNRCSITGRSRGYYRKVALGRNMFRLHAMNGDIPGLVKSSW